jgi:cytochrome c-type biogenesis protein
VLEIFTAFAAGVLSFFSPCIFPLIPAYISIISGISVSDREKSKKDLRKIQIASVLFVLGFAAAFCLLGASSTLIGKFLFKNKKTISTIAGIAIIIFALYTAGIFKLGFLNRQKTFKLDKFKVGFFGAFMMGFVFALGWIPCTGPVLAGFLALAGTQETVYKGILLMFAYSAGLGIPFIIAGFAIGKTVNVFIKYKKVVKYTRYAAAAILFVVGIILILHIRLPYFKI